MPKHILYMADDLGEEDRHAAIDEFRAELREFCEDGLTKLAEDAAHHRLLSGCWSDVPETVGCPLSYRLGRPGSVSCDSQGRDTNWFTYLWDNGFIITEDVAELVAEEVGRRVTERRWHAVTLAEPATV